MPGEKAGSSAGLARSAGSVSIAVFFSRILGLLREQVLAGLFGAGTAMDAFVVAYRIPNLLRDLFAEGALSAAFVSVFTEYEQKRSREDTLRLVSNVLAVLTVTVSIIVIIGMVSAGRLVTLLAPDFADIPGKVLLTKELTIIMFPFLLFISVSALFMGILNTRGYFFIPSFASSCFNLASITIGGGLALLLPGWGLPAIFGMAVGTLLGGLAQLGIQLPLVLRQGFRPGFRIDLRCPGLRRIGRLIVPAIIGLSATQINIFINTNFASRCAEGSVAWLNYSFRLMQFPIGLFGVALSVATLPVIARQAALRNSAILGETLVSSLTLAFALTTPAAVGLWVLAEPVIGLIYQHGRFSPYDTFMTAQALKFYSIGLLAYSAVKIIVPVYYALDDTRIPVIGSFIAVAANICIILATIKLLQHRAIALSTSLSIILNFLLLAAILYRKLGGFPAVRLFFSLAKILAASGLMGAAVWWISGLFGKSPSPLGQLVKVLVTILTGMACYGLTAFMMGIPELREVSDKIKQRIFDR
ncbi:MAG TPA: murein biosynthesis integral membrane protein MurJ [Thermodesulfobacteriaceae bacterium]|nr:murein biosynthesis integral membrane protein MurJ [Thermodesulfobacteriaceae bacterium]